MCLSRNGMGESKKVEEKKKKSYSGFWGRCALKKDSRLETKKARGFSRAFSGALSCRGSLCKPWDAVFLLLKDGSNDWDFGSFFSGVTGAARAAVPICKQRGTYQ